MNSRLTLLGFASLLFATPSPAALVLHSDIPEDQRRLVEYDLAILERLAPKSDVETAELARKMGIGKSFDAHSLQTWLESRMRYVVPQEWEFSGKVLANSVTQAYPNAGIYPVFEKPKKSAADGKGEAKPGTVTVIMSNLGASLYLHGKKLSKLLTVEIDRAHRVAVLSPRLGLIKIGQMLFSERYRADPAAPDTEANAMIRLTTYFHEARHSDGNGTTLGLSHAVCPAGHDYEGYSACERNRNGPYTIGTGMLKMMLKQCSNCSKKAREVMRAKIADQSSRVILQTPVATNDLTLAVLKSRVILCDLAEKLGRKESKECASHRTHLATALAGGLVDTVELDAAPEMIAE